MAVTALEAAVDARVGKMNGAIIEMFTEYSPIMNDLPMVPVDGTRYEYERDVTLPGVGWRGYNEAWAESTGVTNPFTEYMKVLGGEVKSDRLFEDFRASASRSPLEKQIRLKIQALSNEFSRAFFEGSELSSTKEMVGLRPRIGTPSSQLILQSAGGGTLTLAKLNALIDAVPFSTRQEPGFKRGEGIKKILYMNRTLRTKINALIEAQTGSMNIVVTKDTFGRYVEMWRDAEIRVVEVTGDGSTVLDFDEDPGDGTADTASIYCVAMGEDLVHGIRPQKAGPDLFKIDRYTDKPLQSEPRYMVRFEGLCGMAIEHPRSVGRLYGITNT